MNTSPRTTGSSERLPPFDPLLHGFVILPKHRPPGEVRFYEWRNHACVDGTHDYHRLNGYLSQDRDFVTIWFGLLEPIFLDSWFQEAGLELPDYNEELFRGHIESEEQARHILKALRPHIWRPQILRPDPALHIVCELLEDSK